MSEPQPNGRIEQDPLLDFSIEAARASISGPSPATSQPVAAATVPSELDALRQHVDQLEKALEQSNQQLADLRTDVATLVGVKRDIRRDVGSDRAFRAIGSIAGIALGIVASVWFWMSTANEPTVQTAPVVLAGTLPDLPPSKPPAAAPKVIVPAVVVSPARQSTPQPASAPPAPPHPPRRADYVGTLSIDADPSGEVLIDGKRVGTTPLRAENLKAGSHLIWIQRDGYRRFTRVVQVPADRITRLVADLEPLTPR